jgi:uncharacterized protein
MANYKRPGVYVEETLRPLTQALSEPGDAYAAFVGVHYKGPTLPTLVTSWTQFTALYGGFDPDPSRYLAHSVYQFFNNGGRNAYIVRAANANAVAASVSLMDIAGTPAALLTVTAKYVGTAGNSFYVTIEKTDPDATGAGDTRFNLYVHDGGSTADKIIERFNDLSMDPGDPRYAIPIINSPEVGSTRISVAHAGSTAYTLLRARPAVQAGTPLTAGSEGTGSPAIDTAAKTLETIESSPNIVLNMPGETTTATLNSVITWAAALGSVFVVVDAPAFATSTAATVTAAGAVPAALNNSSYVAVYGPWLLVDDPATNVRGSVRALPPGGAVVGQYQRTDAARGVQKPPAGVDNVLTGVLGLDTKYSATDLGTLNEKGVNAIKPLPGIGYCVFGARTASKTSADRYISVRRVLMSIKKDLIDGTRWALFEPNDEVLWDRLENVISDYLTTAQQVGLIRGTAPTQGFYVKVDGENNTEQTVAAGEVNIEVGLALLQPAEFIVIKIGQYSGGSVATENV